MTRYRHAFDPDTSYGSAVRLVEAADPPPGLALDLGCGYGGVAEVLRDLGLEYVGVDADADALRDLGNRGFETHEVDLLAPPARLAGRLRSVVGGRSVSVMLALDVLEHLLDVPATLRVLAAVADEVGSPQLVVSYPNVTHYDVGAKLLLGRWEVTDEGLLDRTHTQFVAPLELPSLFAAAGWRQVDADDVVRATTEQVHPSYAPALHPGTPLRELLRRIRERAAPGASTYQMVRRFERLPADEAGGEPATTSPSGANAGADRADEQRPFASVIVLAAEVTDLAVLADLEAQEQPPAEVVVATAAPAVAEAASRSSLALRTVVADDVLTICAEAMATAIGRYFAVIEPGVRVRGSWLADFAAAEAWRPGRLLRAQALVTAPDDGVGATLPLDPLDLLHVDEPGAVVGAAYLVPTQVVRTGGIVVDPAQGVVALPAFLALTAMLCGVAPVPGPPTVVVAPDLVPDADRTAPVPALLEDWPLVLPEGSSTRLDAVRRRTLAAERSAADLARQLETRSLQADALALYLRDFDLRLRAANEEIERLHDHLAGKHSLRRALQGLIGRAWRRDARLRRLRKGRP